MLNLLGDIFLRSQNLTDKEFIANLERRGIEYTVRRLDTATCIEVGRFCYRFNEEGQSRGGWINNCAADRRAEWEKWAALLTEPFSQLADSHEFLRADQGIMRTPLHVEISIAPHIV